MIERSYCVMMARYNAWQNSQLANVVQSMSEKELTKDRKAFFGSILATLNHVLWADFLWMSRFDGGDGPPVEPSGHATLCPTGPTWSAERFRMDGRIKLWAQKLDNVDLKGELSWFSMSAQREFVQPLEELVVHFFNHQTHHRGQVHAMLTAAGQTAPVTDIAFMPKDA